MATEFSMPNLARPFPASDVRSRQGQGGKTLDYIDIATVINRLNESTEYRWSSRIDREQVHHMGTTIIPEVKDAEGNVTQKERRFDLWGGVVTVTISMVSDGFVISHSGIGADTDTDLDKVLKTAQAEATKKAAHQFGIGIELWDEDHRATVQAIRKGDISKLKPVMVRRAMEEGVKLVTDPEENRVLLLAWVNNKAGYGDATASDLDSAEFLQRFLDTK